MGTNMEKQKTAKKIVAGLMAAAVLLGMLLLGVSFHTEQVEVKRARMDPEFITIKDVTVRKVSAPDTPVGIRWEYTFFLDQQMVSGSSLAFYITNQYACVWLDGEEVYSLLPTGQQRFTKTTGSNWVMIPLYDTDEGKEVRVEITPVYESFKDRQVVFLTGSSLAIYRDRLIRDLPQILLGGITVVLGIAFLCIGGYDLIRKRPEKRIAALGLFSVIMGIWRLNDTRFTPFMENGKPVFSYYMALMMPMLGMLPLMQWIKPDFSGRGKKMITVYEAATSLLCILQIVLQCLGILDLRESISATHIAIGIGAALLISLVIAEKKRQGRKKKMSLEIRLAGICIAGILADIAAFYAKGNSSGLVFSLLAFLCYIVCMGISMAFRYSRQQMQIAEQNRELAKKERSLTDSRIKMMMSQIRSHFIFNVLATISTYCKIDPKKADRALICFSRYLRRNIRIIEEDGLIDFATELEQLEDYIALEQLRFTEKIVFEKEIGISGFKLPPLTVQPIVENAIKHGLVEHGRSGTIFLRTEQVKDAVKITIADNGAGFDPRMLQKTDSIGIKNVRYRLRTMTGGSIDIESEPGRGTTVTLRIPQQENNG